MVLWTRHLNEEKRCLELYVGWVTPFVEFTTTNDKVVIFGPWTKDDGNRAYHKFTFNRSMK